MFEDLFVGEGVRPVVGIEDGRVQGGGGGLSQASRHSTSARAQWAMAATRGSSSSAGSCPGGQGKGKVSKVVVGVYRGSMSSSDVVPWRSDQSFVRP